MQVTVNGTDIYFEVHGSGGERPTLLALHGGPGFDHRYLELDFLTDVAQLVYLDLRAHGRSGRPPVESWTLEQMADDVAAVCGVLGIERPVVLGHSAGGFVALHLTLRHPGLVGGLVLCATMASLAIPEDATTPRLAERAGADAEAIVDRVHAGDTSPATLEAFASKVLPYYAGPEHTEVPVRLMSLTGFNVEVAAETPRILAGYDLRERLADIAVPALVLVGRHDWVCPPARAGRSRTGSPAPCWSSWRPAISPSPRCQRHSRGRCGPSWP